MTDTTTPATAPASLTSARAVRPKRAARKPRETTTSTAAANTASATAPTKLDLIVALLARPGGASLEELRAATAWQVHSIRGAMAGALKRKGHVITSEKHEGIRRYRAGTRS